MVATLRAEGATELVIAGGVRRPDLWKHPARCRLLHQPAADRAPAGGRRRFRALARGALLRGQGPDRARRPRGGPRPAGGRRPHRARWPFGRRTAPSGAGLCRAAALGAVDAGQAVVVAEGRVLAIEGAEGTDAMLRRVAGLRRPRRCRRVRRGVLAKGPKPGQELRVDMPAIGPRTVEQAAAAGLAGVAVEAGGRAGAGSRRGRPRRRRGGWRCTASLALEPRAISGRRAATPHRGRVIGRCRPSRARCRGHRDGARGRVALARSAPARRVVVVRLHPGDRGGRGSRPCSSARRALRQWGVRLRARVGVMVCRAEDARTEAAA